jgi:two-component system OmpR family response regulator
MSEKNSHLLVVDDDIEICALLVKTLTKYGFEVSYAYSGEAMHTVLAQNQDIDLIILDIMMPGEDGLTLCRKIRNDSALPVLMLTAMADEADRIVGLELGADDYLAKPFNPRELVARIKAILRRYYQKPEKVREIMADEMQPECYQFDKWYLDPQTRCLYTHDHQEYTISSGEFVLLMAFIQYPQEVLSRDQLLDITQNRTAGPFDRSIDVQVSRLRQKIELEPKHPQIIKTIRGGGYLFTPAIHRINQPTKNAQ